MWIPGPSSENVAGVGELSLAFFFKSCLSVIIESEWGCSLLQNVGFSVWGLLSGQSTDSVAVAHLLASWNVGSSCIRDRMHRSLRWQRVVIHCTTREVQLVAFKTTQKQGWHRMWWGGMFFVALTTLNWSQQPSATNWDLSHPGRVRAP